MMCHDVDPGAEAARLGLALADAGPEVCEGYLGELKSAPPLQRAIGAVALEGYLLAVRKDVRAGKPLPESLTGVSEALFDALDSLDRTQYLPIRAQLIRVLGELPFSEALPMLVARFDKASDFSERLWLALALSRTGDERAVEAVARRLDGSDPTEVALAATVIRGVSGRKELLERTLDRLKAVTMPDETTALDKSSRLPPEDSEGSADGKNLEERISASSSSEISPRPGARRRHRQHRHRRPTAVREVFND